MSDLGLSLKEALRLILTADPELTTIVLASLRFSISSTVLASLIAIPAGVALASTHFRSKKFVEDLLNTTLAIPTVVVGLFVYTLLSSQGPFGSFQLLFTPAAIIIGQTVLIVPLIASLVCSAVSMLSPVVRETALTLGAGRLRAALTVAGEARAALLVSCITGFGRVIGEVGISLILGGNILGYTRTITTAISLQTSRGEFALGLALGMILLFVAFFVNVTARRVARRPS